MRLEIKNSEGGHLAALNESKIPEIEGSENGVRFRAANWRQNRGDFGAEMKAGSCKIALRDFKSLAPKGQWTRAL